MSEKNLATLLIIAGLVLVGILAWRKGLLTRVFGPWGTTTVGYPQPFAGGLGPAELGPAAPGGGGSTYSKACNYVYSTVGKAAQGAPDPRAQAAGVAAQVGGPAICAAHEWVADKVWDGTKWVAKGTASTVKAVGSGVATGAKAVGSGVATGAKAAWNNTLGKLF
jgi:hypothetical protein